MPDGSALIALRNSDKSVSHLLIEKTNNLIISNELKEYHANKTLAHVV